MLGLTGTRMQSADGELLPVEIGTLKVMSLGLILDGQDQAVIWRGPLKMSAIRQLIADVAWGDLDLLVVDCPPGTGDEPLSVIQLIGDADGAIVVTTPQEVALADVRRSINFCRQLKLPVLGVVENMSGLVCPHCQEVIPLFKVGGGEAMATAMHVPFLGRVPLSPAVVDSGDGGHPILSSKNDNPAAQALRQMAQAVGQRLGLQAAASEVVNDNV
jgi:Mrp family chromosome partitioning ATPase